MTAPLQRRRGALLAGLSLGALLGAGALPITFEQPLGEARLVVRASLWSAMAQGAGEARLENVVIETGFGTFRIPRIDFAGASLPRAELAALFDAKAPAPLAERLDRLSARQVTVPELVVEQKLGGETQTTRYRNLVASDLERGRVRQITGESTSFTLTGKEPARGSLGRMTLDSLDLGAMARVYGQKAAAPNEALTSIYGGFAVDGLEIKDDKGVEVRFARVTGRDFRARPIEGSWAEISRTLEALEAAGPKGAAGAADRQKGLRSLADVLRAYQVGAVEVSGVEIRDPKDQATGRISRIAYTGAAGGQPSDARLEGLEIAITDGRARIGSMSFTGFDFGHIEQGLRAMTEKPVDEVDAAALRKLIPTIGTVRMSGLDFDVPKDDAKPARGAKPERVRFTIAGFEFTADRPVNGIPTNLSYRVDGFNMPIPAGTREEGLKDLAELGYKALDLSFNLAATWNEAANEVRIADVSFRGAEMGSLNLKGTLGGVTRDAFNPDTAIATVALLGATARALDVTIENKGVFERLVAREARKQKRSPEEVRREYGMGAAVAVPALLGNSANAKALGQAVARFVAKPGRLAVTAKTRDPAGLGVADLASVSEPSALLDRLEITAVAE